ncbi:hypothetical protein 15D039_00011 [Fowlpox virus]|uniref:Uncharacterized protein n=1 Tax=Fowlpox virus TaxID=10261 RepID=A0A7G0X4F6_FOWPV|nr:hypothetical protein [Fowlpox virus]URH24731.1 hypothetical protein 10D392_00011 [Fowlpox virus]URH24988.1 hypothetical protein 13D121_00012 [Fowlpox virus]URH25253.1 hypothetical protein 14D047_00012 [Fowlpox virus]URH25514.1 hypothetical protein 15D039_00011 [Fowlpox virus]
MKTRVTTDWYPSHMDLVIIKSNEAIELLNSYPDQDNSRRKKELHNAITLDNNTTPLRWKL